MKISHYYPHSGGILGCHANVDFQHTNYLLNVAICEKLRCAHKLQTISDAFSHIASRFVKVALAIKFALNWLAGPQCTAGSNSHYWTQGKVIVSFYIYWFSTSAAGCSTVQQWRYTMSTVKKPVRYKTEKKYVRTISCTVFYDSRYSHIGQNSQFSLLICKLVNQRPTGGGGYFEPPSRFFAISSKPMQISPPNLQYPLSKHFCTLC